MADKQEAEESDLDEEAALLFYKGIEERLKRKRKNKRLPEDGWEIENDRQCVLERINRVRDLTDRYTGTLIVCRSMIERDEAEEEAEMDGEAKRGITYQVQWNWLWKRNGLNLALLLNIQIFKEEAWRAAKCFVYYQIRQSSVFLNSLNEHTYKLWPYFEAIKSLRPTYP